MIKIQIESSSEVQCRFSEVRNKFDKIPKIPYIVIVCMNLLRFSVGSAK